MISRIFIIASLALLTLVPLGFAASDWHAADPKEWNGDDVYKILNNSPWSKTVKTQITNAKDPGDALGNQSSGGSTPPPPNQGYGTGGGMRRGGYGASSRTYSSGGRGTESKPSSSPSQGPTEVTIQWQSALPVQIAAAKKIANDADISQIKPLDNYIVAVIGLPIRALGGRAASVDSDQTLDGDEEKNLQDRLKLSTELMAGGHEALHPIKVELNQGVDGRILFYFNKSEPITLNDKTVDFKLISGHTKIEKKFVLKDMLFKGELAL